MASHAQNRTPVVSVDRLSRATAGLVFSLIASSILGLTIAGSSAGLSATLLGTLTLASLVLHPICARQSGYRPAIVIAVITAVAALLTFVSSYGYGRIGPEGFVTVLWGLLQVAVIKLAYDANRRTRMRLV